MRPNRPLIVLLAWIVLLAVAPAAARANDYSLESFLEGESGWKGHGVGSSVTETTTVKLPKMPSVPNMPNVPGMPKDGKMVTTEKTTLTKITAAGYELSITSTSMGRTTTRRKTEPKARNLQPKLVDAGEGTVTVAGTAYTCSVKSVANMGALLGDSMERAGSGSKRAPTPAMGPGKVFVHAQHGVLRLEATMTVMGQKGTSVWQVTRLSVPRSIAGRSITCREVTLTNTLTVGTSNVVMLMSPTVPGGALRTEVRSNFMGGSTTSTTEITQWDKKPVTAVTGK